MAKKPTAAKTAADEDSPKTEAKVPLAKMRGPRGVPETATITLLTQSNPKRSGSKAHAAFAIYATGMKVGQFCDAVDKLTVDGKSQKGMGTPHLVYDTGHGFIKIEGYEPPGGVMQPKPKAPAKPKAEKVAKPAKDKAPSASAEELAATAEGVEAAVEEETVD